MPSTLRFVVAFAVCSLCGVSPSWGATRVGLLPLERIGEADPAYDSLELGLHRQAAALSGAAATDVVVPATCAAGDAKCLAQAGQTAGAELVIASSVERFPDGYVLRMRGIPVATGTPKEIKRLVQGGAPDLLAAAELSSCQLLGIEKCEGSLRVYGPAGTRLLVDGKEAGSLPFAGPIAIGRHALRVMADLRKSDETWVTVSWKQEVAFNATAKADAFVLEQSDFAALPEIAAPLPPPKEEPVAIVPVVPPPPPAAPVVSAPVVAAPAPVPGARADDLPLPPVVTEASPAPAAPPVVAETPAPTPAPNAAVSMKPIVSKPQQIAFYSAAAATGAMLLGGIIAGSVSLGTANGLNSKFAAGTLTPADRTAYDTARGAATTANVFFGLAGLGAVTAGAVFLTDPRVMGGSGGDVGEGPSIAIGPTNVTVQGRF